MQSSSAGVLVQWVGSVLCCTAKVLNPGRPPTLLGAAHFPRVYSRQGDDAVQTPASAGGDPAGVLGGGVVGHGVRARPHRADPVLEEPVVALFLLRDEVGAPPPPPLPPPPGMRWVPNRTPALSLCCSVHSRCRAGIATPLERGGPPIVKRREGSRSCARSLL